MMQTDLRFARHDRMVMAEALAALRRRRHRRHTAAFLAISAAVLFAAWPRRSICPAPPIVLQVPPDTAPILSSPEPEKSSELSDQELLAVFPPGSCYFAEVAGHKRLIFRDDAVRGKYFN
jgi:hypothetical protein